MKPKYTLYLAILFFIAMAACTGNDKPAEKPDETTADDSTELESIDTVFSAETIKTFNSTAFSAYAKQQSPGFNWGQFHMTTSWTDDSLLTTSFNPGKDFFDHYGSVLKYSPDSTMFIDLDSYSVDIKKNSSGQLKGDALGPDTEVSLVNPKAGKKTRILFLGPNGSAEDALWMNNEDVVIIGVHDYGEGAGKITAIWKYNIPTNTFFLYELQNDTATAESIMGYGRKERLKGVINQ